VTISLGIPYSAIMENVYALETFRYDIDVPTFTSVMQDKSTTVKIKITKISGTFKTIKLTSTSWKSQSIISALLPNMVSSPGSASLFLKSSCSTPPGSYLFTVTGSTIGTFSTSTDAVSLTVKENPECDNKKTNQNKTTQKTCRDPNYPYYSTKDGECHSLPVKDTSKCSDPNNPYFWNSDGKCHSTKDYGTKTKCGNPSYPYFWASDGKCHSTKKLTSSSTTCSNPTYPYFWASDGKCHSTKKLTSSSSSTTCSNPTYPWPGNDGKCYTKKQCSGEYKWPGPNNTCWNKKQCSGEYKWPGPNNTCCKKQCSGEYKWPGPNNTCWNKKQCYGAYPHPGPNNTCWDVKQCYGSYPYKHSNGNCYNKPETSSSCPSGWYLATDGWCYKR